MIVYWEAMQVINLDTRVLGARFTVSHKNVGWAFLIFRNSREYCLLTGRGFNVYDPKSEKRKIGIYVAKMVV